MDRVLVTNTENHITLLPTTLTIAFETRVEITGGYNFVRYGTDMTLARMH